MQEGYFYRDRRPQERVVITQKTYRLTISIGYLLYAAILVSLLLIVDIKTVLIREDFVDIAQLTASISAICLALFPLIQVTTPKSQYLKLAIASLSINFVLATLLAFLALVTTDVNGVVTYYQTIKIWILVGILLTFSITGMGQLTLSTNRIVLAIGRLRLIDRLRSLYPNLNLSGKITDYSPLFLPFVVILVWSNPVNLVSATIVLTIGGLIYLFVLSVAFALQSLQRPVSEDDRMKSLIMEILQDFHIKRFEDQNTDEEYELISAEAIGHALAKRNIIRNERYLQQLIEEMGEENLIYADRWKCYIFPTSKSIEKVIEILDPISIVITGIPVRSYSQFTCDGIESFYLSNFLSRKTKFPADIVTNFFLPAAYKELNASFDYSLSSNKVDNSNNKLPFMLYAKSQDILDLWENLETQQQLNQKSITVRNANGETDYSFYSWFENNIEVMPKGLLDSDEHDLCKKVFIFGISQVLGIEVKFDEEDVS